MPNVTLPNVKTLPELRELQTQLTQRRRLLIAQLGDTNNRDRGRIEEIQADLSIVNAQLKAANIAHGRIAKSEADRKNAAGQAEYQANTRRALDAEQVERAINYRVPGGLATTQAKGPAHTPPKLLTRGEFLMKNAKQMQTTINRIPESRRLPHTQAFLPALAAFIAAQKHHLQAVRPPVPTATQGTIEITEDPQWRQTWQDDDGGRDG